MMKVEVREKATGNLLVTLTRNSLPTARFADRVVPTPQGPINFGVNPDAWLRGLPEALKDQQPDVTAKLIEDKPGRGTVVRETVRETVFNTPEEALQAQASVEGVADVPSEDAVEETVEAAEEDEERQPRKRSGRR